ncbi:hypothetical protein [Desulfovibrio psychrotolerans]|uniref:Dinitrogenase iron-molybdenum cofactor biosynthesis protein n=1 Tax=Desulfovibrio psychrotolerans TaxID=415242 RepID=A0A7J0BSZ0_9BACT|nr:hypothetical protein [Desulfovibrio psychrotolerans]GFM36124.1 hypothetical protein DSM19430T_08080 [Desulfovibrio psychrotolerans]
MIVCLAMFNNRLAAVFDSADTYALYQVQDMQVCHLATLPITHLAPAERNDILTRHCVSLLVCGALCGCDRRSLQQTGMEVEPWVCGTTDEILNALCLNQLESLRMPGCRNNGNGRRDACPTARGQDAGRNGNIGKSGSNGPGPGCPQSHPRRQRMAQQTATEGAKQ